MSEIENKVEEPVVAQESTPAVVAEPVHSEAVPAIIEPSATETTETLAAEEPVAETETETAAAPAETAEEVKEIASISEGVLGYKGPGLLKSLRFSKKYFWLGDEPVELKLLTNYLRGEKPEVGNKNGAWAAHTGKGLLFFSKTAAEKAAPGGIINLAEISDVSNDGVVEFFFQYQGHKYTFQAANVAERDSWVAALKVAATEAKANAEGVTTSEPYKEHFAALSKPAVPAITKKEEKAEDKAEKKEEKKEEGAAEAADKEEAKEEKKEEKKEDRLTTDRKSRSQSRKRASIFGAFNKKKEEPKAVEPEATAAPAETPVTSEAAEAAPVDAPAETPVTEATDVVEAPAVPEVARPAFNKRTSIFGQLQSRFSNKKEDAAPPAVPAKDDVAAPETTDAAPVIPVAETETPLSADTNSPATVPTEATQEATAPGEAEATPKAEKRKSALPFGFGGKNSPGLLSRFGTKKNKKSSSDEPAAPVTSEKAAEETTEALVTEIPSTNGEAATEQVPARETTPVAATA